MIEFLLLTALLACAGIALVAWPLLRTRPTDDQASGFSRWPSVAITAITICAAVAGIYPYASNWHWQYSENSAPQAPASVDAMIARLEQHLRATPDDLEGWLMLGRSYGALNQYYRSADAYERANTLANGNNVEALLGFGEALVLADQNALSGRAGDLLERALTLEAQNPRALWWGGATAYQRNDFATARTRWQQFLASNPPPDVAQVVRVKISEIDQRLGRVSPPLPVQTPATASSSVASARARVRVELAADLKVETTSGALFVLARRAGEPGAPLAVKRLALGAWPVDVELSEQDSMMPGRVLTPGDEVQIIARISRAGTAAPASGDSYGEVRYRVGRDGLVTLRIDKKVQ